MLLVGYLADLMKIWKLLTITNIIVLSFYLLVLIDLAKHDCNDISMLFSVGYCLSLGVHMLAFMLCITWLSKIVNELTRATIFNVNGIIGSIAILVF